MKKIISLILIFSSFQIFGMEVNTKKKVLLLNSYHHQYKWTNSVTVGIEEILASNKNIDLTIEFMDTKKHFNSKYLKILNNLYQDKYKNKKFDVVITTDDNAFNFYMKTHSGIFKSTPLAFAGKSTFDFTLLDEKKLKIMGVFEVTDFVDTFKVAQKLHQSKTFYIITDSSATGLVQREKIKNIEKSFFSKHGFIYLNGENYTNEELIQKVKGLKKGILFTNVWGRGRLGKVVGTISFGEKISKNSTIPLYGFAGMRLGRGIVGGKLLDGRVHGQEIAKLVNRYLDKPNDQYPIEKKSLNKYMFDASQLKRFGVAIEKLPLGSILINQEFSFYTKYKIQIIATFSFMLLLFALVIVLFNLLKYKKKEGHLLKENKKELEAQVQRRTQELTDKNLELTVSLNEVLTLQDRILSQEKLASVGRMTAGVAHEIKNPIYVIHNSLILVNKMFKRLVVNIPDGQSQKELIEIPDLMKRMMNNCKQVTSIITNMLALTRGEGEAKEKIDFTQFVDECLKLSLTGFKTRYEFDCEIVKNFDVKEEIFIYKDEMARVLMNVFENGFYAMRDKAREQKYSPHLIVSLRVDNEYLDILIQDNGTGIPKEHLSEIFDPFFTTKPTNEGTGLGLSLANEIILKHDGKLSIKSELNVFTCFSIRLPRIENE